MDVIRFSIRFNPQWILKEAEGQQQRVDFVMKIYDEIRRIDQEIIRKTTINREEIMNDNFFVLTEQEEFVNPHTGKIEIANPLGTDDKSKPSQPLLPQINQTTTLNSSD
jgi:hypothetical protein